MTIIFKSEKLKDFLLSNWVAGCFRWWTRNSADHDGFLKVAATCEVNILTAPNLFSWC